MPQKSKKELLNPNAEFSLPEPETIEEELLREMWDLASEWLKTKEKILAVRFHMSYLELRSRDWQGSFDVEEELLYESMRETYPQIFGNIPSFRNSETR
jgi:hypothetical protein